MQSIKRSALFKRQLLKITGDYRERAGSGTALKFLDEIENAVTFIAKQPQACAIYTRLEDKEFRKWRVGGFPVSIFFRMEDKNTVVLEALYAHRMNIAERLSDH